MSPGSTGNERPAAAVMEALALLGKRRLALAIHDSCFPQTPDQDIGRGSPYSRGARAFLGFVRGLGFDAIQFGPQGQTTRDNPSPYDGTLFSRNLLNLDLAALTQDASGDHLEGGLLSPENLAQWVEESVAGGVAGCVAESPAADRLHTQHTHAFDICHAALDEIHGQFVAACDRAEPRALALKAGLVAFTARQQDWLAADALYHALAAEHGGRHHRDWPLNHPLCPDRDLYRRLPGLEAACWARRRVLQQHYRMAIERYCLAQFLLHQQHAALRRSVQGLGLRLYGDLQVGISPCDAWSRSVFYLEHYHMGAPPSRTNPAGQPWGYGVLDPEQYRDAQGQPGAAMRFLSARVGRLLEEFDGLRIDHPHGLVCPWVYRLDDPDPYHAVQQGARLFSSPQLADHPALARYAIVRDDQLDHRLPRYADHWVQSLEPAQLDRYALLMDAIVAAVRAHGADRDDVLCEVLSTLPYPLGQVITRHGLGRFRVTQKADLDNPADVYRSENARPEDWIMVGNHDTPPLWRLARDWIRDGQADRQADYLAQRLVHEQQRSAFARELAADPRKLVHAKLADIFASPAAQVMIFFADLFGLEEDYNRPGVPDPDNWLLRVPHDYARHYPQAIARGEALNLPCVLVLALRAQGPAFAQQHEALIRHLQQLAGWWVNGVE